MGGLIALAVLLLVGAPVGLAIWVILKLNRTARETEELQHRIFGLELALRDLRREHDKRPPVTGPVVEPKPVPPSPPVVETPIATKPVAPPPLPPVIEEPVPEPPAEAPEEVPEAPRLPAINWEQFMGVKLFAWIGGLALFLGVAFFVKYSFDNNLITPEMRVAIGYVTGAGLLIGGLVMARKNYEVLGLTLCATGVLVLYANTFAAHGFYHLIGVTPAFALMILVTVVAFLLAVRLDAQVVAVLGLLGGFLTPVLLSTGEDHPLGLFGYIALLDAGLVAVVARKRWNYQVLLAAVGTVVMQIAWTAKFFMVGKVFIAMSVLLGFELLFLVAFVFTDREDPWINIAAVGVAFVPLVYTLYLLTFRELGAKPWVIFAFVLGADIGLLALVLLRGQLARVHLAAGTAAFLVLAIWLAGFLTPALLNWALGVAFVFAVLHTVFPVVLERVRPGTAPVWWGHLFAPVALVLVMFPIFKLPEISWMLWLCVLALDVVVFGLAFVTASILAVIGALVLTVLTMGAWILKMPATLGDLPELLVVVGGFALVFFGIGIFAAKRIVPRLAETMNLPWTPTLPGDARAQIPAFSAVLPFLLLIMVVLKMPIANPSPVFGLAMLLVVLLLGVVRWVGTDLLAAVALVCVGALEYAWHALRFKPEFAVVPLAWLLAVLVVFMLFPFLFRRALADRIIPWAVAALAGPVQFGIVYRLVKVTWPNDMMGLLPAAFAIPPLLGLLAFVRERRVGQLAWFGGATLFFITLIFPIQFEQQWITIGWALEGAALLWLYRRVPHWGLPWVGIGLLCVAFGRLAVNPAVLEYHARSATPILNWYLYAYGIVTVCLFVGARLVENGAPGGRVLPATLGTVLAFVLLNIEIADYFTPVGARALTFEFSGNFARDMTYSIAWALFALVLLLAGIGKKLRAVRYASLALLGVTLLKLFLHDLAHLKQLYRIGALIGVAVVSLLASFLYQKFVSPEVEGK